MARRLKERYDELRQLIPELPRWRSITKARNSLKTIYRETGENFYQYNVNGADIIAMINFLIDYQEDIHNIHLNYNFHPYSNVDENEIELNLTFVNRRGEPVSTEFKPSQVIHDEGHRIIQRIRNYIEEHEIEGELGNWFITIGAKVWLQNTHTGDLIQGGFDTEQAGAGGEGGASIGTTLNLFDDRAVNDYLQLVSEFFEERENSFVRDGYEWRIVSFEGFIIRFSPRNEHRHRKRGARNREIETQRAKKRRIEEEAGRIKKR